MKKEEKKGSYIRVIKENWDPYLTPRVGEITSLDRPFSKDIPSIKELEGPENGYIIGTSYRTPAFLKMLPF